MNQYNLENLPPVWCVDIQKEKDHPRLGEFKKIFTEKRYYDFDLIFYGYTKDSLSYLFGANNKAYFQNKVITLDTFFALIDPLRLEEGNWLCCTNDSIYQKITNGKLYQIKNAYGNLYIERDSWASNMLGDSYFFYDLELVNKNFRNATPEEIAILQVPEVEVGDCLVAKCQQTIERHDDLDIILKKGSRVTVVEKRKDDYGIMIAGKVQYWGLTSILSYFTIEKPNTKVSFQKNETVLVRDSEDEEWQERLFIIEHEGLYYCAVETHAGLEPFKFIKKPDLLRQKLDAIIEEYAKAGIKLTPNFENI